MEKILYVVDGLLYQACTKYENYCNSLCSNSILLREKINKFNSSFLNFLFYDLFYDFNICYYYNNHKCNVYKLCIIIFFMV